MVAFALGKEGCGRLGLGGASETALFGAWVDVPTKLESLRSSVVQVSAGDHHAACLTKDLEGKVFAWGNAICGTLGVGDTSAILVTEGGTYSLPAGAHHPLI